MPRSFAAVFALALAGCQQQMAHQPAYRPLEASPLFADQRSARPLLRGTVPWSEPLRHGPFYTGRADDAYLDYVPIEPDRLGAVLRRGQERFNIYCAPCHDRAGSGRGMIVQRGFTAPPSFHGDLSRGHLLKGQKIPLTEVPVGYLFEVISDGFGAMPSYGKQVPPEDRWAIVAYLRGPLQFHQRATLDDIKDPRERQKLLQARGHQP
jgi:mono/diheme cytochrome c family protein